MNVIIFFFIFSLSQSKATERKYDMFYQDEVVDSRRQRIRKMPFSLEEFAC